MRVRDSLSHMFLTAEHFLSLSLSHWYKCTHHGSHRTRDRRRHGKNLPTTYDFEICQSIDAPANVCMCWFDVCVHFVCSGNQPIRLCFIDRRRCMCGGYILLKCMCVRLRAANVFCWMLSVKVCMERERARVHYSTDIQRLTYVCSGFAVCKLQSNVLLSFFGISFWAMVTSADCERTWCFPFCTLTHKLDEKRLIRIYGETNTWWAIMVRRLYAFLCWFFYFHHIQ